MTENPTTGTRTTPRGLPAVASCVGTGWIGPALAHAAVAACSASQRPRRIDFEGGDLSGRGVAEAVSPAARMLPRATLLPVSITGQGAGRWSR
jgi:hypothetical protein